VSTPEEDPVSHQRRDSTARSRYLGAVLRRSRERAGFGGAQLARTLCWSPTRIAKLESGERGTDDADLAAFLATCGVRGAEFARAVALQRAPSREPWFHAHGGDPVERAAPLVVEERRASAISGYHHRLVPELLRTPEYALALDPGEPVDLLQRRQEVLERVPCVFYVEQHALRRVVGDARIAHEQLMQLVLSPAAIRVLPPGGVPDVASAFTVLHDERPVVHVDTLVGGVFLEHPCVVAECRRALDALDAAALDAPDSRAFLLTLV
jgi:transcriptional regulator with XRE-family HTH domain